MPDLKAQFLLDPDITFLNHGSFGATPRPVLEAAQQWQRRLERQPVQFLIGELFDHLAAARQRLAAFLHADPGDLVYIPNATYGVNVAARSLRLNPGDEILMSNHEYGACEHAWQFVCRQTGAKIVQREIALPVAPAGEVVKQLWAGVTPRTRVIFLSHITSPTALTLPVAEVCRQAREAGILTAIDGAHAPGQIPLDLEAIGADFYAGNLHKWALAPKGAGFLYTRREHHLLIEPLVVSWGWNQQPPFFGESAYLDNLQWPGTHDPSAYLAFPAALDFMQAHDWPSVRAECHIRLRQAVQQINELTGLPAIYPDNSYYHQMAAIRLPQIADLPALKARLYDDYRVEVPLIDWHEQHFVRVSVQGYNTVEDIQALVSALAEVLPK